MNYNETLHSAILVVDEFYKDTGAMLEILRGIFVNDFNYLDMKNNRVCWEGSSSILCPLQWSPPYLSFWLQDKDKENDFISITITLKDYWNKLLPKKEFQIYGCKFYELVNPYRDIYWIGKDSAESPSEVFIRIEKENCTEIEKNKYYDLCRFIKKPLWEMKDRQAIKEFAEQINKL